eukprot:m.281122 g.281122  ORF g.281122 m.281122 type:complete len:3554 (+) comp40639_c1_seq1:148-10809(+)
MQVAVLLAVLSTVAVTSSQVYQSSSLLADSSTGDGGYVSVYHRPSDTSAVVSVTLITSASVSWADFGSTALGATLWNVTFAGNGALHVLSGVSLGIKSVSGWRVRVGLSSGVVFQGFLGPQSRLLAVSDLFSTALVSSSRVGVFYVSSYVSASGSNLGMNYAIDGRGFASPSKYTLSLAAHTTKTQTPASSTVRFFVQDGNRTTYSNTYDLSLQMFAAVYEGKARFVLTLSGASPAVTFSGFLDGKEFMAIYTASQASGGGNKGTVAAGKFYFVGTDKVWFNVMSTCSKNFSSVSFTSAGGTALASAAFNPAVCQGSKTLTVPSGNVKLLSSGKATSSLSALAQASLPALKYSFSDFSQVRVAIITGPSSGVSALVFSRLTASNSLEYVVQLQGIDPKDLTGISAHAQITAGVFSSVFQTKDLRGTYSALPPGFDFLFVGSNNILINITTTSNPSGMTGFLQSVSTAVMPTAPPPTSPPRTGAPVSKAAPTSPPGRSCFFSVLSGSSLSQPRINGYSGYMKAEVVEISRNNLAQENNFYFTGKIAGFQQDTEVVLSLYSSGGQVSSQYVSMSTVRNGVFSGVFRDLLDADLKLLDSGSLSFHVETLGGVELLQGAIRQCGRQPYDGMLSAVLGDPKTNKTTAAVCLVSATTKYASRQVQLYVDCNGLASSSLVRIVRPTDAGDQFLFEYSLAWNPASTLSFTWTVALAQVSQLDWLVQNSVDVVIGDVRGTLMVTPLSFSAIPAGKTEVPVVDDTTGGAATFAVLSGNSLSYETYVSGMKSTVFKTHIHGPAKDAVAGTGPLIHDYSTKYFAGSAHGTWTGLTAQQVEDLYNGYDYINIHTTKNTAGALRGHLKMDAISDVAQDGSPILMAAAMSSGFSQTSGPFGAAGMCRVSLVNQGTLEYHVKLSSVRALDSNVQGMSWYAQQWDGTLVKLSDLNSNDLLNEESRGQIDIDANTLSLLVSNRLYVRATSANIVLQGQIFFRKRSFGILGLGISSSSGAFGLAELDMQGNLHVTAALLSNSPVTTIGISDSSGKQKVDMTYALVDENSFDGFWQSVPVADLFSLSAGKLNFYFTGPRISPPTDSQMSPTLPDNYPTHFYALSTDFKGGFATTLFYIADDNQLGIRYWVVNMASAATLELQYNGTKTFYTQQSVGIPNPFADANATGLPPTITTQTMVPNNISGWFTVGNPVQLGSGYASGMMTVSNPPMDALQALVSAEARVVYKDNQNKTIAMTMTSVSHNYQFSLLSGASVKPTALTNGGSGDVYMRFESDGTLKFEVGTEGLLGDLTGVTLANSSGSVIYTTDFITGIEIIGAVGIWRRLSVSDFKTVVSGKLRVSAVTDDYPAGELTGVVSWRPFIEFSRLTNFRGVAGGQSVLSGGVDTTMAGEVSALLDSDGVVLVYVLFDSVASPVTGIWLVYQNETTGTPVQMYNDAFLVGYMEGGSAVRWKVPNDDVMDYLLSSKIAITISTADNPNGEIMGTLSVVSSNYKATVTATDASGPAAGGVGVASLNLDRSGTLHAEFRFNNKQGEPVSVKLMSNSGTVLADLSSQILTSNLVYGPLRLDEITFYNLVRGGVSVAVSLDTTDPAYKGKTHMTGTLMGGSFRVHQVTHPMHFEAALVPSKPDKLSGFGGYFEGLLDEDNTLTWRIKAFGGTDLLSATIYYDPLRKQPISTADVIDVLELEATGKVALSPSQLSWLSNGKLFVVVMTRTSSEYNLEGTILFRKKEYGGVFLPSGPSGMGGYGRMTIDTNGWLHYELVLSGLSGPLSYVAYEYNDKNQTFLENSFTKGRARGAIKLTIDVLRGIADGTGGMLTVGVVDSTVTNPAIVMPIFEFLERDSYPWFAVGPLTGQQVALADGTGPAASRDTGVAFVYVDSRGDIDFSIFSFEVEEVVSAAFYGPAPTGYTGPMLRAITDRERARRSGKWINPGKDVLDALTRGMIYVLIKSTAAPNGELRAQILPQTHEFSVIMSSSQEVSPVTPSGASGFGKFVLDQFGYLHYRIVVEGITQAAIPAHIHGQAEFYQNAKSVHHLDLQLINDQLVDEGRWGPLGWNEIRGLMDGQYYVNVHSDANKAGEVRGHIRPNILENYYSPDQFEALLSGDAAGVQSAGAGYGQFWLDDQNNFNYLIEIVGTSVSRVAIRGPADIGKTSQNELYDLTPSFNGLLGSGTIANMDASNRFSLTQRKLYILVSDSKGNNALRGQILFLRQKFTAVLSQAGVGRSTPLPAPASAFGLATISVANDGRFQYAAKYPNILKYSSTVLKQPNWGDRTWTPSADPSVSTGASQLVSDVQTNNLAYRRTTLEVQTYDPQVFPVVKGTFLTDAISTGVQSLLFMTPFVDGVLTIILGPGNVQPPSDFFLSAGGYVELIFDKENSVLMYSLTLGGITGKITKAEFHDKATGATKFNILPAVGAQSFNGYSMVSSSISMTVADVTMFSNDKACLQIESSSTTGQLSKIRACVTNTFVRPACDDSGRQVSMNENLANTEVTKVIDSFLFPYPSRLSYKFFSGNTVWWANSTVTLFQDISMGTGSLLTSSALDYERQHQHTLLIGMFDGLKNYCNMTLIVNVVDLNDNDPYFIPGGPVLNATVKEQNDISKPLVDITVNDQDGPTNGNPTVEILQQRDDDGNDVNVFNVVTDVKDSPATPSIAHIMTNGKLNYDKCDGGSPVYTLNLKVTDKGDPSRSAFQTLVIYVVDVNDQPPVFQTSEPAYGNTVVDETHRLGVPIQNYTVTDCDVGGNALTAYSIIQGDTFDEFDVIATDTGFYLTVRRLIDAEKIEFYQLIVRGCNVQPPGFCRTALINVTVLDIPFKIEIGTPPEFVQCQQNVNGWYSPSNDVSLTSRSNVEDGVTTVPQFQCRIFPRSDQDCVQGSPIPKSGATCSVTCGVGSIAAYRPVLKPAFGSGKPCTPDPVGLTTTCQRPPCPTAGPTAGPTASPTPTSAPGNSSRRRRAVPPGNYFETASPYDQPPPLDVSNVASFPFKNCGLPNQLFSTFDTANLTDGEWEFQVRGRVANPAQGVTATYNNSIAWIVDTVYPDTTVDQASLKNFFNLARGRWVTNNRGPLFAYSSNEDSTVFKCRMTYCSYDNYDGGSACFGGWEMSAYSWIDCNKVWSANPALNVVQTTEVFGSILKWDGWYRLEVAATDCAGNRDASPAEHVFELDTEAPLVGIHSVPARIIKETSASIGLLKSDSSASFQCKLNSTAMNCASGTLSLSGLVSGTHQVSVTVVDEAGNVARAADYTFHVEATLPKIRVADPQRFAIRNRTYATVYLEAETVFQDIACRAERRQMQSLIRNCCMVAFGGKEVSKGCLTACNDTRTNNEGAPISAIPTNPTCNAMMRNYTMCLKEQVNKVPAPQEPSRGLYLGTCEGGSYDMGRSLAAVIDVYTFEVSALDQGGNRQFYWKNYVFDPRFVSEEAIVGGDPIIIPDCDPPVSLLYIILVSVAWGLVLITVIIFIIICSRQRSGPQPSRPKRGDRGHAMRPISTASRTEENLDISQFEASAVGPEDPYEELSSKAVNDSEKAPISANMESSPEDGIYDRADSEFSGGDDT